MVCSHKNFQQLWRCFVIYQGCRVPSWLVNVIPMLLYLGSIGEISQLFIFGGETQHSLVTGILYLLVQVGTLSIPGGLEWLGTNISLPYFTISFSFNLLITILLVSRLLVYRHRIAPLLGAGCCSQYISLAAMIVESAAIYSTIVLILIISSVSLNYKSVGPLFIQVFPPVHVSCNQL